MNEEQRRLMIDALEQAFAETGIDLYAGASRLLRLLDSVRPHVEASCSREALDAYFATATATDSAELAVYVAFFTSAPALFQQFATDCAVKTADSIPRPVGPPRKLTPEIERDIVRRITHYYTVDGLHIGTAQTRVAQQLVLGKRTVQTAWRRRHQLAAQPFQTISDAWKFFAGTMPKG